MINTKIYEDEEEDSSRGGKAILSIHLWLERSKIVSVLWFC